MSREHDGYVRLHRGPFSGTWFVVKVAGDGACTTITDKWTLHPDDAAVLDQITEGET